MSSFTQFVLLSSLCFGAFRCQTTESARPVNCPAPPVVRNADVNYTSTFPESKAVYSCRATYRASGTMEKICRNGAWTPSYGPSCNEQYCSSPPRVDKSSYRLISSGGYRYSIGSMGRYTCYAGYTISPPSSATIQCQVNLTWTTPLPSCQPKDCGLPDFVANSNMTYTNTTYNSAVKYKCNKGYSIQYPNSNRPSDYTNYYSSRCGVNGWSGKPQCVRRSCGVPPTVAHSLKVSGPTYRYGDTVLYECALGFHARGNDTIICQASAQWTPAPECIPVTCTNPPQVPNASHPHITTVKYGNRTSYTCKKGYVMEGLSYVTCKADGTWSEAPKCYIADCRTPPAIHFGSRSWTSTTFQSKATYTCEKGYKLIGVPTVFCQENSRWSDVPTCELPPGSSPPGPKTGAQKSGDNSDNSGQSSSSAVTGLAIACAAFGIITLLCIGFLVYKFIISPKYKPFSYASYKNGEETVTSNY